MKKSNILTVLIAFIILLVSSSAIAVDKKPSEKKQEAATENATDSKGIDLPEKFPESKPPIKVSSWDKDFIQWLGEHYIGYYKTLLNLEKKPDEYKKNFRILKRRLGEIRNIHQRNPELGQAKMDELRLSKICNCKVNALKGAKTDKERKKFIALINKYVAQQFENNVKISKLTHAELKARIQKLSRDLENREKKLNDMIKNKDNEIKKQVQILIDKAKPDKKTENK